MQFFCAPDDGWRYHPKYVEQFPDKINCVTLHLVGYVLEYGLRMLAIGRSLPTETVKTPYMEAMSVCHIE
jgi:hypothetical protein